MIYVCTWFETWTGMFAFDMSFINSAFLLLVPLTISNERVMIVARKMPNQINAIFQQLK